MSDITDAAPRTSVSVAVTKMSEVEDARNALIELQNEQDLDESTLNDIRVTIDQAVARIGQIEQRAQERRQRIIAARQELERAERLEAAREQAEALESDVQRLSARFLSIARDKPWYTGVGADDAIMPHQWQGVQFGAVAKRWLLGDGPGLGKTRQAVGFLDLVGAKRVVVVAERNICAQFAGEIMEYAPHRTVVNLTRRTPQKRHQMLDTLLSMDEGVAVVNFEIWRRDKDVLGKLISWEVDSVIIDEAHNLKRMSTSNYKNIELLTMMDNVCPKCRGHIYGLVTRDEKTKRKVPKPCPTCGWKKGEPTGKVYGNKLDELLSSKSVKHLCLTTGTPILNSPEDLFPLLHLINPVLFPSLKRFKEDYLIKNYFNNKWDFRDGAMDRLKPFIEHMFLARKLGDVGVKLPPQHPVVIPVEIDKDAYPKQLRTIQQITKAAQIVLDSGESMTIMHLIALITRKRQANVWPGGIKIVDTNKDSPTYGEVLFDAGTEIRESAKMDAVQDMIEFHKDSRQIVFSQFKTGLSEFEERLTKAGFRVCRFDGDTPEGLRQEIRENFDRRKGQKAKWDVVLANYKTGGTGLNFSAATVTHILDEEWNPGKRDQAYHRTHRIGQTEETYVYVYRVPRSIDTWMANIIRHKERIIEGFEDAMMSPDELRDDLKKGLMSGEIL